MAQASKMGADVSSREARRNIQSGHVCQKCGQSVTIGELIIVQTMALDERGRGRKTKSPFHRGCY